VKRRREGADTFIADCPHSRCLIALFGKPDQCPGKPPLLPPIDNAHAGLALEQLCQSKAAREASGGYCEARRSKNIRIFP
jgi:hypothetical protein